MANIDQGQVAATAADVYEDFFIPALFGAWPGRVLRTAGLEAGARVLDVGCGTGILARHATRRVGTSGYVAGVDPNDGMLAVARRLAPLIDWRLGRAEALPFDDARFDCVASQFAMMFFTDRGSAVAEMHRVLAPGGAVAIATWSALDANPGYAAMAALLDELFGRDAARALEAPFVLGDAGEVADAMRPFFPDVTVTEHAGYANFASIAAWVHTEIRGWTLADLIDDDQYRDLLAAAETRLADFADASGRVRFPSPALIATACKTR